MKSNEQVKHEWRKQWAADYVQRVQRRIDYVSKIKRRAGSTDIEVTRVWQTDFKIVDQSGLFRRSAVVTYDQANETELHKPEWKQHGETVGGGIARSTQRTPPAKKKPGRRTRVKNRKSKNKGKK